MSTRKKTPKDPPPPAGPHKEIELDHIGPIDHLRLLIPADGGLVVLKGRNGMGKSRALAAIQRHITGQGGNVDLSDGADRGGVSGLGMTMKIARSITRAGELEVLSIEGRFSVLDLVEPGIKDPALADGKRIKALLQLVGDAAKADASLFYKLVGGKQAFGKMISSSAVDTSDLVVMAAAIKRDIEGHARKVEDELAKEKAAALANKNAAGDIDTNQPHDRDQLSAALEAAVRHEQALKTRAQGATDAEERAAMARIALREAAEEYDGPTVPQAEKGLYDAAQALSNASGATRAAEAALRTAREEENAAKQRNDAAAETLRVATEHETAMQASREAINAVSNVEDVAEEDLTAAAAAVSAAREAVEQGALIRRANESLQRAEAHRLTAKELDKEKDRLRDAAAGVDGVLSGVVKKLGCPLRVVGGRLVTDTDRGVEKFAELSRGEQWKLALDIAIDAVGSPGLLVIDQSGYEGLDPENRRLIADHLKGSGVVLITAEATEDEELRAEEFSAAE